MWTRRAFTIIGLVTVVLLLTVATANAGVLDRLTAMAAENAVKAVVAGVFFVLSMFFGTRIKKWYTLSKEGVDVIVAIYKATRPGSPGGEKITGAEIDDILVETKELGPIIYGLFK